MTARELYEKLKPAQEKRGFHFNPDETYTLPLLTSLLVNKGRYGYTSCPCRLASGSYELDRDIICPCVYAGPDIEEFGACFCGLYVSKDFLEGRAPRVTVPERRPAEKSLAALLGDQG